MLTISSKSRLSRTPRPTAPTAPLLLLFAFIYAVLASSDAALGVQTSNARRRRRSRDHSTPACLLGRRHRRRRMHHHNGLRLRRNTTRDRHLRLSVFDFARHLALHAPQAAHAREAVNVLRDPDASQRRFEHTLGVQVDNDREREAVRDEARRAAVRAGILRDPTEVARPATERVHAIPYVVEAPEQGFFHRHHRCHD